MTRPVPGGRRRVDRVLDPGYLDGLATLPLDEVRRRRAEVDQEETDLSFLRRVLHARLDLLMAEAARRRGSPRPGSGDRGGSDVMDDATLVARLSVVLADRPTQPHGLGRHLTLEPTRADEHRREPERAWSDITYADPGDLDDTMLASATDRLQQIEVEVSEVRRDVQRVADALAAETMRRYRDGEADVDALLPDA